MRQHAPMSRRDDVSDADRALFRASVGAVRTLDDDRVHAPARRRSTRPAPTSHADVERGPSAVDHLSDAHEWRGSGPGEHQHFSRPGLQQRLLKRLARGQLSIEADLDLHGMTVTRARSALAHFLAECTQRGVRFVRIVHGKGFGSPDARPVLKAQVDRWLRLRPDVLAFHSAPRRDGGTGALYVVLRRRGGG